MPCSDNPLFIIDRSNAAYSPPAPIIRIGIAETTLPAIRCTFDPAVAELSGFISFPFDPPESDSPGTATCYQLRTDSPQRRRDRREEDEATRIATILS